MQKRHLSVRDASMPLTILWPNRFMVVLMWLVVEIGFAIAQQAPGAFVTGAGSAKKGQVAAACVC